MHRRSQATVLVAALAITAPGAACLAAQSRPDLYRCDGCEAIHERSFDSLSSSTTIPASGEPGERLVLTGRVLLPDGRTPAAGVVVYAYHTNAQGVYPTRGDERGWDRGKSWGVGDPPAGSGRVRRLGGAAGRHPRALGGLCTSRRRW